MLQNFRVSMENTPKIDKFVLNEKANLHEKNAYSAKLKLTMFLHEHNLPFWAMVDHLQKLVASICPDSPDCNSQEFELVRTKRNNNSNYGKILNTYFILNFLNVFFWLFFASLFILALLAKTASGLSIHKNRNLKFMFFTWQ